MSAVSVLSTDNSFFSRCVCVIKMHSSISCRVNIAQPQFTLQLSAFTLSLSSVTPSFCVYFLWIASNVIIKTHLGYNKYLCGPNYLCCSLTTSIIIQGDNCIHSVVITNHLTPKLH